MVAKRGRTAHQVCNEEEKDECEGGVAQEGPLRQAIEAVVVQDRRVVVNLQVTALVLVDHTRAPPIPQPVDVAKPEDAHHAVNEHKS